MQSEVSEALVLSHKGVSQCKIQKDKKKINQDKRATIISNNSNSITQNTMIVNDTIKEVSIF